MFEPQGRKGYRTEDEPIDERSLLVRGPFWRSDHERATYESAVKANPIKPGEGSLAYVVRVSEAVTSESGSPFERVRDSKMRAAGDVE